MSGNMREKEHEGEGAGQKIMSRRRRRGMNEEDEGELHEEKEVYDVQAQNESNHIRTWHIG